MDVVAALLPLDLAETSSASSSRERVSEDV